MSALAGIRVLDLTRILAGPFCTQQLADHGADVWKIERPGKGDDTRAFGPPFVEGQSTYFMSVNRGKRSVAVDLKHPDGLTLVKQLADAADVVVENFRPGAAEKLGLGAADLMARNPRLVYCSMSGFGHTGPWRNRPGYDLAIQGMSGLQSLTGPADGAPHKAGLSIADLATGLYASQGILMALLARERTGVGDVVDIAMLDVMLSLLTYHAGIYFADGTVPQRKGNRHPSIVPYETFPTADGWFNLAVGNDQIWARFCGAMALSELIHDGRFATNPDRVAHRDDLFELLAARFAEHPTTHWVTLLGAADVPCGPIHDVAEALELEQAAARGMLVELQHAIAGQVRSVGSPIRMVDAPPSYDRAPPTVGQHTAEVLKEVLGLTDERIAVLVRASAIAVKTPDSQG